MRIRALIVLGLLLTAGPVFAAEVDGQWTGTVASPTGPIEMTFLFASKGAELTGSYSASDGNKSPVKDGKIDGSTITFALDLNFGAGPVTFKYVGEVSASELKISSAVEGVPIAFTLAKKN